MSGSPPSPHPVPCQPGYYSAAGALTCTLCPVGTYCPLQGTTQDQMKLNLCPAGTFCSRTVGATTAGLATYPDKDNNGCAVYHYCPAGTTIQMTIPPGTMISVTGAGGLSEAI